MLRCAMRNIILNYRILTRLFIIGLLTWMQACASAPIFPIIPLVEKPYFETPPSKLAETGKELFKRALSEQINNRTGAAVLAWNQFIEKYPNSFESLNNLGLVYYDDDRIDQSIMPFEAALALEPRSSRIKTNLVQALKLKSIMLKETKNYNGAVDALLRAREISTGYRKEKIDNIINQYEDHIFYQAKQVNTPEAYESFFKRYPNSAKNPDDEVVIKEKVQSVIIEPMEPSSMEELQQEEVSSTPDSAGLSKEKDAQETTVKAGRNLSGADRQNKPPRKVARLTTKWHSQKVTPRKQKTAVARDNIPAPGLKDSDSNSLEFAQKSASTKKTPSLESPPSLEMESPASDPLAAVDQILNKLEFEKIAFNGPHTVNLNDTAIIQLFLGLATPTEELQQMVEAAGEKANVRIRVSDRMEARLSGSDFDVAAVTPELQVATRTDGVEWKWEIKPKSEGRHDLYLTLFALIDVDGAPSLREIRTFEKKIEVEVTWGQQAGSLFKSNWAWVAAIILTPAGWVMARKLFV